MDLNNRLHALKTKHGQLDMAIADENKRPAPNSSAISLMKRQKLYIKDELEKLSS